MAAQRKTKAENNIIEMASKQSSRSSRPASNPEAREQQLVSLAVDLAEKQLKDGTASSAVISHYLKIASKRETLEREILQNQSKLIEAKTTSIAKEKESEEMTKAALEAFKSYNSGSK